MQTLISTLRSGRPLDTAQIEEAAEDLIGTEISDADKGGFLRALSEKGETPEEIAGFASCFLRHAVPLQLPDAARALSIDVCGTGGDRAGFFNISTAVMFVAAAAGLKVVKHGNRGITSRSGGADALEALGIPIDLPPKAALECLEAAGCVFLFAPAYHPAFKAVAPVRKQLAAEGVRTMFNILGPLLNPASPRFQLVGVFSPELVGTYAEVLRLLGRDAAWVVHGSTATGAPVDEISLSGPTSIGHLRAGVVSTLTIEPGALGFAMPAHDSELLGGDAVENAQIISGILEGSIGGAKRDVVVLNTGAALTLAGRAADLAEGCRQAETLLASGAAHRVLIALQGFTRATA